MMGLFFLWCRKKTHVRLIPLQTERDDKVCRTKVQLSAIRNDDAEIEGISFLQFLFSFYLISITCCKVGEEEGRNKSDCVLCSCQ